ncbi:methyltransferase [Polyangium aurulentum]|uniref:methyltransferase n=1 Tax=Polyangium aurulentum TaxID=2567896 RepID=UPI0010AE60C0|nr:methyltransferase [Polyangium aurulentum]UQA55798.1 methyltransferase domain-containing protein [Polyangium aurulentum]
MNAEMMDLFAMGSVLAAAQDAGLVHELPSGPLTAQAYAEKLGLDPRATRLVLEVLVTLDVASRNGDFYDASPKLRDLLAPGGVQTPAPIQKLWSHVPQFLRTGEPLIRMDASPTQREESYRGTVSMLARMFEGIARALASKIEKAPARVLDVGCGSGVWSLALAERFPQTHVTGLDFPAVLESFTSRAKELGLADRTSTIPGNMHDAPLPSGAFDMVVIANVLRLETPDRAAALLARLAPAVAPGGALLVVDALAGGTPERERSRALYALNLSLRTQQGRVHSPEEITGWLETAGLHGVEAIDLPVTTGAVGALLGRR